MKSPLSGTNSRGRSRGLKTSCIAAPAKNKIVAGPTEARILTGGFDAQGVNDCDGYRGWREAAFTSACILSSEGSAGRPM